jgi:Tol biopolymer transport system component
MYAANAVRIPSTDVDDSDALGRRGRRAAAAGPRWLWRAIVVALCLGLALGALSAPAWAAKDDLDLVSRAAGVTGTLGNGSSDESAISADGRYVAFTSWASNLHPHDGDGNTDVFVRDMVEGTVTLVSRASGADGAKAAGDNSGFFTNISTAPAISADGRYVAFQSRASNLHPDDGDATLDVFVRDLEANTTTLVSRAGGADGDKASGPVWGGSGRAAISADGRYVAFQSWASNLHPDDGDTTPAPDVFVRDLREDTTTLVSRASGADGEKGDNQSGEPAISADGRYVAFDSGASNLHPDYGDTIQDVFVRDLETNTTTLVSRATGATGDKGDSTSEYAAISADGRFVAFSSDATNLHPDDADTNYDVFVRDLEAHTTTLVNRAASETGAKGDGEAFHPVISADGRFVAFESDATNLHPDDTDDPTDILVRDLKAHTTTLVSRATGADGEKGNDSAVSPAISADGRFVAFESGATNLYPDNGDTNWDVFRRDVLGPVDEPAPPAGPTSPPAVPASASAPPAPAVAAQPALGQLRLASRCVRPSRSGRVRIRMSLRMAQPGPLQIRIDRAVGGGVWHACPSPNPQRRFTGRFKRVATLSQLPGRRAAAAASVARRVTLKLKLSPGLYRITVRAKLDHNRLSRPARRYLRVLG